MPNIGDIKQASELEKKVDDQQTRIKLLEWHIRELEQVNPELAGDNNPRASVETLQEAYPYGGSEEKVHPFGKSED